MLANIKKGISYDGLTKLKKIMRIQWLFINSVKQ